jgi:hypothetical protein
MSNSHSSINGRSNGSLEPSLQNNNPNPVVETTGQQGTSMNAGAVAASVKTLAGMASSLGIGPAESSDSRRLIASDGVAPDALTEVAIEVATENPDLVEKHFDTVKVEQAKADIAALQKVASTARGLAKRVDDEILRRRAVIGIQSRALYRFLSAIAPEAIGAPILEPLDRMTRSMKHAPPGTSKKAMAKALKEATAAKGASAPAVTAPSTSPPPTEGTK